MDRAAGEFIDLGSRLPLEEYHEHDTLQDPLTLESKYKSEGDMSWNRTREEGLHPWIKSETVIGHVKEESSNDFEAILEDVESGVLEEKFDILCPISARFPTDIEQDPQQRNHSHMKDPICHSSLKQTCEYQRHTMNQAGQHKIAMILLTKIEKFPCNMCDKSFTQKGSLNLLMKTHVDERPFTCDECGTITKSKVHLRKHLKWMHCRTDYACKICGKSFAHQSSLKTHNKTHKPGTLSHSCEICNKRFYRKDHLERHEMIHTRVRTFSCETCRKQYSRHSDLTSHYVTHAVQGNCCKICNTNFENQKASRNHVRTMHKLFDLKKFVINGSLCGSESTAEDHKSNNHESKEPLVCDFCGKIFSFPSKFKKHLISHSSEKPHPCKICDKKFGRIELLKKHMKVVHENRELFSCEICGKSLKNESSLKAHVNLHIGKKTFSCKMCGDNFAYRSGLRRHLIRHTGLEPYSCNICGRKYTEKHKFEDHQRTHTGEKPFQCEICGKCFGYERARNDHLKTHTERIECKVCKMRYKTKQSFDKHKSECKSENRFKCDICPHTSSSRVTLWRHKLTHQTERRLKCDHCDASFHTMGELIKHTAVHTGDWSFTCTICGKNFQQKSRFEAHTKKNHEDGLKRELRIVLVRCKVPETSQYISTKKEKNEEPSIRKMPPTSANISFDPQISKRNRQETPVNWTDLMTPIRQADHGPNIDFEAILHDPSDLKDEKLVFNLDIMGSISSSPT
ncbi:hypothetical protein QAD02_006672, partial [Eretmocerus hayati]